MGQSWSAAHLYSCNSDATAQMSFFASGKTYAQVVRDSIQGIFINIYIYIHFLTSSQVPSLYIYPYRPIYIYILRWNMLYIYIYITDESARSIKYIYIYKGNWWCVYRRRGEQERILKQQFEAMCHHRWSVWSTQPVYTSVCCYQS